MNEIWVIYEYKYENKSEKDVNKIWINYEWKYERTLTIKYDNFIRHINDTKLWQNCKMSKNVKNEKN